MENLDLDCLSIRCPPSWIEDFGARDLALAVLYYECEEENDYSFYAFKLRQFNDLMSEYLEI